MASESISTELKQQLKTMTDLLNPFDLKRRIEAKLKHIFQFVLVTSNVRQRI